MRRLTFPLGKKYLRRSKKDNDYCPVCGSGYEEYRNTMLCPLCHTEPETYRGF